MTDARLLLTVHFLAAALLWFGLQATGSRLLTDQHEAHALN